MDNTEVPEMNGPDMACLAASSTQASFEADDHNADKRPCPRIQIESQDICESVV